MSHLQLVEPDDSVYAALSGKFADYNAAHATWDWKSDSIVAGGRGILNIGALDVRGAVLTVRCRKCAGLSVQASSGPA